MGLLSLVFALAANAQGQPNPDASSPADQGSTVPAPGATTSQTTEPLEPLKAEILSITGKTVQYSLDRGNTWQPAQVGVELNQDGVVRTGFASECEVSFRQNTIILVKALSCLRVEEYQGSQNQEVVRANLRYGAIRCGVEKGRIQSDTQIRTPVATLGIRGTITQVEYDRGTNDCLLSVLQDGPADAMADGGVYRLAEGMSTDSKLSRHLETAIFSRAVFVTGSFAVGDITALEAEIINDLGGTVELPADDPLTFKIEDDSGDSSHDDADSGGCPNGECDTGPTD